MAARNDFVPNKLTFDTVGCMELVKKIIHACLDELSLKLVQIVITEIGNNGNGSRYMRTDACLYVKETKREVTDNHILLEVGIDTEQIKNLKEDLFVRISVVLHGNMNGMSMSSSNWRYSYGAMMYTKPGQETYGKHVTDKRVHVPEGQQPRAMPGFAQGDKMADITEGVSKNVDTQITKYVNQFIREVNGALNSLNWSAFIGVG